MSNSKLGDVTPFVVENGYNTCYMDSLLMALFYTPSHIEHMLLKCDPTNPEYLYLQELIKIRFVDTIRKNQSITADVINEIRNYSHTVGWKGFDELMEQHDVNEYHAFLMDIFNGTMIEIQRQMITEGISIPEDKGAIEKIPFIPLTLLETDSEITIKDLLKRWMSDNTVDVKRETINDKGEKIITNVKGLNTFYILNTPVLIALSINRFPDPAQSTRLRTKIEIQKKIMPLKNSINSDSSELKWQFHAAICHKGETFKSGHYYAILQACGKWFMFDDLQIPSMCEIPMDNLDIINMIKMECVFVLYHAMM
jgi:ubiquitin C-terminal hydrolase